MRLLAFGAVLAVGASVSTGSLAVDKQQVLKDRQALMKEQASDLGAVKNYLEGKVDQAKATAAATDLSQTMKKLPGVFPPGTEGPSPDGKFEPKPAVWAEWNDFLARRDRASGKVDVLIAAVKGGDKAKIQAAFADLGKNGCGDCHEKFRAKLQ